jgi:energy-coupling factor transporter ATP-binding protein EcfA2
LFIIDAVCGKGENMAISSKAIKHIQVRKLFGTYDYLLTAPAHACDPDRLMILYGDNGSGKTTILKTLFHLLAPERREGHKTAVVTIPFSRFEVGFRSGDHVWAQRPEGKITGGFTMGLRMARKKETTVEFNTNEEGAIKANPKTDPFLKKLRQLNIALYFLSDDRTIRFAGREGPEASFIRSELFEEEAITSPDLPLQIVRGRHALDPERRSQQLLLDSIKRA